jgi:hypothetical protein
VCYLDPLLLAVAILANCRPAPLLALCGVAQIAQLYNYMNTGESKVGVGIVPQDRSYCPFNLVSEYRNKKPPEFELQVADLSG